MTKTTQFTRRLAALRHVRLMALLLATGAAACFTGDGLVDQPCQSDDDCNPRADLLGESLRCVHNVCGYTVRCGDGIVDESEQCDDGNKDDDDMCTNDCAPSYCGDGIVQDPEACDDGNQVIIDDCVSCQKAVCGDGVTWAGHEQCDDGNNDDSDACLGNCKLAVCGDGEVHVGAETCDDGNPDNTDACTSACKAAACGDGFVWAGHEICDDGNTSNLDPCLDICELNTCGDGFTDPTHESCDDQNNDNNDGCADVCKLGAVAIGSGPTAYHTCVVRAGAVRCWGSNFYGQLGIGSTATLGDEPGELPGNDVTAGGFVTRVVGSAYFTCVLLDTKQVRCWGLGDYGSLGFGIVNGTLGDEPKEMPTTIADIGGDVADIDAGDLHACALLTNGAVRCWGLNDLGQLGQPGQPYGEIPASMGDIAVGGDAVQVAAGANHTCALLVDGAVRCWGHNAYGQLGYPGGANVGDDETPESMPPVILGGAAVQIDAGGLHTCALLATGALRCWGYGGFGALGYENSDFIGDDETPESAGDVKMLQPGDTVTKVVLATYHTCALLVGGDVRCWGAGSNGRLGYGNTSGIGDSPSSPQLVNVGAKVLDLVLADAHTCALLDGGRVRCWGRNSGMLGVNHTADIGDNPGEMPPMDSPLYPNP